MSDRDNRTEDRIDARLSLSSSAPPSLDERVSARRASGERVELPLPGPRRPAWRRMVLPVGVALAAGVAIFAARSRLSRPVPPDSPALVADAPQPGDSVSAATEDSAPDSSAGDRPTAPYQQLPEIEAAFGGADVPPGTVYVATLTEMRRLAVDSAAAAFASLRTGRVEIEYSTRGVVAASEARAIADSLAAALREAGVAPGTISISPAAVPVGQGRALEAGQVRLVVRRR